MKCLLDAAIHVANIRTWRHPDIDPAVNEFESKVLREAFETVIGHDGSERGFHTQEIGDALRQLCNIAMVPHETYPGLQIVRDGQRVIVPVYPKDELEERFVRRLNLNNGVLVVDHGKIHHALSFQKGSNTAYDVGKDKFIPLEELVPVRFLEFIELGERNENYPIEQGTD